MLTLTINGVPTLFIKAFNAADVQTIMEFVRASAALHPGPEQDVLFIDTPITPATVEAVEKLDSEGYMVSFRDHHGIDGEPRNARDQQVIALTAKLSKLLGARCQITVRRLHPACSTLVSVGEFAKAVAIIADPDGDGLTAAIKSAGIFYDGLDDDAAKLDGEPQFQVTGTPISQLLAKGIATIPSYDVSKPKEREQSQQQLFADWLKAVNGSEAAVNRLQQRVTVYDDAVTVSQELARAAVPVAPGVMLVDAADKPLFDPGTLNAILESDPQCIIIVVRKSLGPIAAVHGTQYSLSVSKAYQDTVGLQELVQSHTKHGPEAGIISNVSFLLHTSEDVWNEQVLPNLQNMQLLNSPQTGKSVGPAG